MFYCIIVLFIWIIAAITYFIFAGNKLNNLIYNYIEKENEIYNVGTFLKNYTRIAKLINEQWDYIQDNLYPTIGWMDCYMVAYYMFCGKDYTENPCMTDTHHHTNDGWDYDKFVNEQPENIEIVNNYKKYYWV